MKKLLVLFLLIFSASFAYQMDGINIHGFLSQGYMKSESNTFLNYQTKIGMYAWNEGAINFTSQLSDELRVGAQIFSRDMGDQGNNEVVLDWALGEYTYNEYFGLRVGKIKTPSGFYNKGRDADMLRNPIFLSQGIYPETTRDLLLSFQGTSIFGNADIATFGNLQYEIFGGTMDADNKYFTKSIVTDGIDGIMALLGTAGRAAYGLPTTPRVSGLRNEGYMPFFSGFSFIYNTPLEGFRVGISNWLGKPESTVDYLLTDDSDASVKSYSGLMQFDVHQYQILSTEYIFGDLMIYGEIRDSKIDYKFTHGLGALPGAIGATVTGEKNYFGRNIGVNYRFNEWLELGFLIDEYFQDGTYIGTNDPTKFQRDRAFCFRFDINPFWVVKYQAHYMQGYGIASTTTAKEWTLHTIKSTFSF